jgi:ComF family protein
VIAALDYAFPWDGLLRQYKFHQAVELRAALLERMEQTLNAADADAPDWLLPVPLTAQRQRERGYNQCFELARVLGKRHKIRCDLNLLLRVRDTARQAQLPLRDRSANVKHAFALEPGRAQELRGKRIVLFDDVMTSGATLFEIARVLRSAGAATVQAWVVARTPDPTLN